MMARKNPVYLNPIARILQLRSGPALFTINNDGTEITASPAGIIRTIIERPRNWMMAGGLSGFRIRLQFGEFVRMARPFQNRARCFPGNGPVRSVQSASNGDLLVCAENSSGAKTSLALFRVSPVATSWVHRSWWIRLE